jgi:hypothetical protein
MKRCRNGEAQRRRDRVGGKEGGGQEKEREGGGREREGEREREREREKYRDCRPSRFRLGRDLKHPDIVFVPQRCSRKSSPIQLLEHLIARHIAPARRGMRIHQSKDGTLENSGLG